MAKSYIHELGDRLSNGFTADNLPKHIKEIAPIMYNDGSNNFNSIQSALNGKAESSHTHGNITNDGKIGTTANLPVVTGTSGAVTTGSFSTTTSAVGTSSAAGTANTFSRGDHVHSISLATGDSDGQVKIAGSNVSVAGWGKKASQFSLGSTASARVYTIFARMSDTNPSNDAEGQVILSSAGNYGSTNQGTWEIIVTNRGSTSSSPKAHMTVRCINAVKAISGTVTEPTFGYYIDTANHYIYFGMYSPQYRGKSSITVLVNNNVTFQDFGDSTTAPTGWTTVTPTGVSSAVKLDTARTIQTDLASTSSASFDGTANITPGVTGTLPVANGGTGATTPAGAQFNLIDKATTELGPMMDANRIAIMSPEPSATNSVIAGYRTGLTMWNYMKGKMSSDTGVNISGNAATATSANKATQDSDGNAINATYFKSSGNVTLVSGTATKIGTQNGTDVKLTLPTIPAAANNGALQLQLNGGTASSKFTANQSGNSTLAFSTGSTAGTFKVDSTEIAIAGFTKVESSSTNGNIKINGTETAVYTHPTTAGNKHIPSGGSSGQFLGYDSAGTAKWVSNPNTDTKQRIVASDSKTYLTGVTTAPTSSNQDLTGVANASVYATAGQLHATTFDVNSKCTLQFNTTTNALDFVFA